jgi:hypothetical protein
MACSTCNTEACGCVSNYKEAIFPPRTMWSQGGNSPAPSSVVLEDVGVMDVAPTINQMQASITVGSASAHFKCKIGYQVSADGVTWDNAAYFGSGSGDYQVGNGSLTTAWNSAGGNYKRKIRFVVSAEQDGGANVIEIAIVSITIGFRIQ